MPTPVQLAVQEEIFYWANPEDVTFVKWWVVPAAQADLPFLFLDAALNKPESPNMHYEKLMAMKEKYEQEKPPSHVVRSRYRLKSKDVDDDEIYHISDGKSSMSGCHRMKLATCLG